MPGYQPATGEWNDSLTGDYLWSNTNFGEAVPEVMTPLTWSAIQTLLADWVFIPGMPMVGNIGGRPYVNVSVLATLFRAVGRGRQAVLDALESTVYMNLPEGMEIPHWRLPRRVLLASLLNALRVALRRRRGVGQLGDYVAANPGWFQRLTERLRAAADPAALSAVWREAMERHLQQGVWCVLGSVAESADYTLRLRHDLTALVGPEDGGALIANVSGGRSGRLASLGPVAGLAGVARGELTREAYLEQYGHRGPNEFELSAPRPAEDPQWLERELARCRTAPVDLDARLRQQRARFDAAWQRLEARHPRQAGAYRRRIAESARRARQRELARSEYVRDRWALRLWALRAGELAGIGEEIFFLTLPEVLALLAGDRTALGAVARRREAYERYRRLPPYPAIIRGAFDPCEWAADPQRRTDCFDASGARRPLASSQAAADVLTGSPGSAGQVEGTVRVLTRPEDGHLLQPGEILVAVQTDIAWTMLFPRAAAVITDVGAPLSHAAIVARELGVPAVVGCGNATQRLRTGDRVRVDGARGVVERLSPA